MHVSFTSMWKEKLQNALKWKMDIFAHQGYGLESSLLLYLLDSLQWSCAENDYFTETIVI